MIRAASTSRRCCSSAKQRIDGHIPLNDRCHSAGSGCASSFRRRRSLKKEPNMADDSTHLCPARSGASPASSARLRPHTPTRRSTAASGGRLRLSTAARSRGSGFSRSRRSSRDSLRTAGSATAKSPQVQRGVQLAQLAERVGFQVLVADLVQPAGGDQVALVEITRRTPPRYCAKRALFQAGRSGRCSVGTSGLLSASGGATKETRRRDCGGCARISRRETPPGAA